MAFEFPKISFKIFAWAAIINIFVLLLTINFYNFNILFRIISILLDILIFYNFFLIGKESENKFLIYSSLSILICNLFGNIFFYNSKYFIIFYSFFNIILGISIYILPQDITFILKYSGISFFLLGLFNLIFYLILLSKYQSLGLIFYNLNFLLVILPILHFSILSILFFKLYNLDNNIKTNPHWFKGIITSFIIYILIILEINLLDLNIISKPFSDFLSLFSFFGTMSVIHPGFFYSYEITNLGLLFIFIILILLGILIGSFFDFILDKKINYLLISIIIIILFILFFYYIKSLKPLTSCNYKMDDESETKCYYDYMIQNNLTPTKDYCDKLISYKGPYVASSYKDICYLKIIKLNQSFHNISIKCNEFNDFNLRGKCYFDILKNNNLTPSLEFCDINITYNSKFYSDCYDLIVIKTKNISYCELTKSIENYYNYFRDKCYLDNINLSDNNISYCNILRYGDLKEKCISFFIKRDNNISYCFNLSDNEKIAMCRLNYIKNNNMIPDVNNCKNISSTNSYIFRDCIQWIVLKNKDNYYCKYISDEYSKNVCLNLTK